MRMFKYTTARFLNNSSTTLDSKNSFKVNKYFFQGLGTKIEQSFLLDSQQKQYSYYYLKHQCFTDIKDTSFSPSTCKALALYRLQLCLLDVQFHKPKTQNQGTKLFFICTDTLNLRCIRNKPGILPVYFNLITLENMSLVFSILIILRRITEISPNELLATKLTMQGQKTLRTAYEIFVRKLTDKDSNLDIFHLPSLRNPFLRIRHLVFKSILSAH